MGQRTRCLVYLYLYVVNPVTSQESPFLHMGCYKNLKYSNKSGMLFDNAKTVHESCHRYCARGEYNFFGIQRMNNLPETIRCYCMTYVSRRDLDRAETCWYHCAGQPCGGRDAVDVYNDYNECLDLTSPCPENAICINTLGSFKCQCKEGYTSKEESCVALPYEHVGCVNNSKWFVFAGEIATREPNVAIQCQKSCGNRTYKYFGLQQESMAPGCYCLLTLPHNVNDSTTGCGDICNGVPCGGNSTLDIYRDADECNATTSPCGVNQYCQNTIGSVSCQCPGGYKANDLICEDQDECSTPVSPCSDNARCENTNGSFLCQCLSGFDGDGFKCTDVDECDRSNETCEQICVNYHGSYSCSCHKGFLLRDHHSCVQHADENPGADLQHFITYGLGPSIGCVILLIVLIVYIIVSKRRAYVPRTQVYTVPGFRHQYENRQTRNNCAERASYAYVDEMKMRDLQKDKKQTKMFQKPSASQATVQQGEYLTCG